MTAITNVTLNGTPLDPQPSRLIPHPPDPIRVRAVNGGYISFIPEKGWSFELQYGSDELVDSDPIDDINSKLTGGDTEALSYTDPTGATVSKTVILDQAIAPAIHWGSNVERFSVFLYEAA